MGRMIYTIACFCFFVGGVLCMYANKLNEHRNGLTMIVALCCLFGGLTFFIGALGLYSTNEWVLLIASKLNFMVGSFLYFLVSVIGLYGLNRNNALFQCLYIVTLAVSMTGIVYAGLCPKYTDWMKNFMLAMIASIGVLFFAQDTNEHAEKNKKM